MFEVFQTNNNERGSVSKITTKNFAEHGIAVYGKE